MKKISFLFLFLVLLISLTVTSVYPGEMKNTAALKGTGKMSFKETTLEVKSILACSSANGKELVIGLLPVEITDTDAANANVTGYCMVMYVLNGKPSPDPAQWSSGLSAPYLVFAIGLAGDKKEYTATDAEIISLNAVGWGRGGTVAAAMDPPRILKSLVFLPEDIGATKVELEGMEDPDYENLKGIRYHAIAK